MLSDFHFLDTLMTYDKDAIGPDVAELVGCTWAEPGTSTRQERCMCKHAHTYAHMCIHAHTCAHT